MIRRDHKNKVIALNRSRLSHAFDDAQSFWDDEIERIMNLIKDHRKTIQNRKHDELKGADGHFKTLLSIALFGTYGSGKSSLLRTLVKRVNEENNHEQLFSLHVLEPTLFERNSNFLYAFLAEALERDRKRRDKQGYHDYESIILTPLVQKVQELSEYLQAVDHQGEGFEDDPIGTSLQRLERQTSALRLQEKMDEFLMTLSNELASGGLVLMPVDDADMNPSQLVSTLQIYRRYLQHPRLIPIFTFTGRMAEELLRAHFEEQMQIGRSEDEDKIREVSTQITIAENLAVQYLGKLFPVRNRIKLGMASVRAQQATYVSHLSEASEAALAEDEKERTQAQSGIKGQKRVYDLIKETSSFLFGRSIPSLSPAVRGPLRSSTLRRQIQIIDAVDAADVWQAMEREKRASKKEKEPKQNDGDESKRELGKEERSFGQIFDIATWSLLNVHRDVLKELRLHLDDLYSWTQSGLRLAILKSVLDQNINKRRDILKHWRYGSDDRRSHMLSLLAANAFRPRMYLEEPDGDDPRPIEEKKDKKEVDRQKKQETGIYIYESHLNSFSCRKGFLWFLNLWHGFYLPQILGRNRTRKPSPHPDYEPVSGVGWDLRSAPIHGIREALNNNLTSSTGMLFLKIDEFDRVASNLSKLEKGNIPKKWGTFELDAVDGEALVNYPPSKPDVKVEESWLPLIADLWCYYGVDRGQPWAAISLWRILGLIGQVIDVAVKIQYRDHHDEPQNESKSEEYIKREAADLEKLEQAIQNILYHHLKAAHVIGNPLINRKNPKEGSPKDKKPNDETNDGNDSAEQSAESKGSGTTDKDNWGAWQNPKRKLMIKRLTEELLCWIKEFSSKKWRIHPIAPVEKDEGDDFKEQFKNDRENYKACFTRRIHGSNLVQDFWARLLDPWKGELAGSVTRGNDKSETVWTARHSMCKWVEVLLKYWDCGRHLVMSEDKDSKVLRGRRPEQNRTMTMLVNCPLLMPFVHYPILHVKHAIAALDAFAWTLGGNDENAQENLVSQWLKLEKEYERAWRANEFYDKYCTVKANSKKDNGQEVADEASGLKSIDQETTGGSAGEEKPGDDRSEKYAKYGSREGIETVELFKKVIREKGGGEERVWLDFGEFVAKYEYELEGYNLLFEKLKDTKEASGAECEKRHGSLERLEARCKNALKEFESISKDLPRYKSIGKVFMNMPPLDDKIINKNVFTVEELVNVGQK